VGGQGEFTRGLRPTCGVVLVSGGKFLVTDNERKIVCCLGGRRGVLGPFFGGMPEPIKKGEGLCSKVLIFSIPNIREPSKSLFPVIGGMERRNRNQQARSFSYIPRKKGGRLYKI